MLKLILSPEGTIGRQDFHKGAVILLALNFFMWLSWYVSLGFGSMFAFLSLGFIYCWGCLFAKRLRGVGRSGLIFIPLFILFAIVSYILGNSLTIMFSPEIIQEAIELQETMDPLKPDLEVVMPIYTRFLKALAIPYAAAYLVIGALIAFSVNRRLPESG